MNLEPSLGSIFFEESRTGSAGELVSVWVAEMMASIRDRRSSAPR
jgi:NAD-dependent deacetylase